MKQTVKSIWKQANLTPGNPPNSGILFVDHAKAGRSGHLGHALVEYENGKILAFYPNCSDDHNGHSAVGWMEYKRSEDGGRTWSDPGVLAYSKRIFDEGRGQSVMSEKAVRTESGAVVLFHLVCDISEDALWQPYHIPTYTRSFDGGHTWTEPQQLCGTRGRVYDAFCLDGAIFSLHYSNDATEHWTGRNDEHVYELYVSTDEGETFRKRSTLPFDTRGRGYGTMKKLQDGRLIAYVYNIKDEHHLDYVVSTDNGLTWEPPQTAYMAKKIRNPQLAVIGDCCFMHGRSGNKGDDAGHMVIYYSEDGMRWDSGSYLRMKEAGLGAYSNSLIVGALDSSKRNRLLIQASHAYEQSKTNVLHWWLDEIAGT